MKRPADIPEDATWIEARGEWRACPEVDGKPHGDARWYRPDGSHCCTSTYVGGVAEGPYQRFHPNGEVSQEGTMAGDQRHGAIRWHRSTAETTEATIPAELSDAIWTAETVFERGIPYPSRYFDREGNELSMSGEPPPDRPAGVDERAVYSPEERLWFFGLGASAFEQRDGVWTWWNTDGRKTSELTYVSGVRCLERFFTDDNSVATEVFYDAAGKAIWRRYLDADGNVVTRTGASPPERPDFVPRDAVFDTGGEVWIAGDGVQGFEPRNGPWHWWTAEGRLKEECAYVDDTQRVQRKYHDNGRLFIERLHDEDGNETREAFFYQDGELDCAIDRTFRDGELASVWIEVHQRGLKARGERVDDGIAYEFYDASGDLEARGRVRDDLAVGTWEFPGDALTVDLDGSELRARVDEDFEPSWVLGRALLDRYGGGDVELLAGVDDIDWGTVTSCYSAAHILPARLRAMTSEVAAVRAIALADIEGETLHQGSVYPATAHVLPFAIALLEHDSTDVRAVLAYVREVAGAAAPYAAQALEWNEDDDDRVAILGTLDAVRRGFASIARFADSDDDAVRSEVLAIASFAGDDGKELLASFAESEDGVLRATAVHGLLNLQSTEADEAVPFLGHGDPLVQCVAATVVAFRFGPHAPDGTTEALARSLEHSGTLRGPYAELPTSDLHLDAVLSLSLGSVRTPEALQLASTLAERMADIPFTDSALFAQGMFALCFGRGERPFSGGFLDVFDAVARYEDFDGFVNFFEVAEMWNLPRDRREYRALAEQLRNESDPEEAMHAVMHGLDEE